MYSINAQDLIHGYESNDYYIRKKCPPGLNFDEYNLFCNLPDQIVPNKTQFYPLENCNSIHFKYYIFKCPEDFLFSMNELKCVKTTDECVDGRRIY